MLYVPEELNTLGNKAWSVRQAGFSSAEMCSELIRKWEYTGWIACRVCTLQLLDVIKENISILMAYF